MRVADIAKENRPRERLERCGPTVLSDAELLAVILKTGSRHENVIDMCHRLLATYGRDKLSSCSLKELQRIKGVGKAKACQIIALFEFNKRHSPVKNGKPIASAQDVFVRVSPRFAGIDRECFAVLHLDAKNKVIREEVVSIGILNASLVHPREVFKSAIRESANAIIIVHNHPSGDPTPSEEDKALTQRLDEAGKLIDIPVLDHVIIGKGDYFSFKHGN